MNDRLKQIAIKAKVEHCISHVRLEEFAELIVEEMYCFMCDATDNDKPWPSFKEVKEHFGVK